MNVFLKSVGIALVALVIYQVVSKQNKDIGILLALSSCCLILIPVIEHLDTIFSFFRHLQGIGNLNSEFLSVLFKAAGIGLIAEIASLICSDAGNSSLGKAIQILSTVVILYLSLPLLTALLDLVSNILDEV